jgi:hypothetical protein
LGLANIGQQQVLQHSITILLVFGPLSMRSDPPKARASGLAVVVDGEAFIGRVPWRSGWKRAEPADDFLARQH